MASIAHGFSLIQLLLSIALISALSLSGINQLNYIYQKASAANYSQQLINTIKLARLSAIKYQKPTTLCHLADTGKCDRNWHEGLQLFFDTNANKKLDQQDKIFHQLSPPQKSALLTYNRRFIHFATNGLSLGSNGHFIYCPVYGQNLTNQDKIQLAQRIIINRQGRVRISTDQNDSRITELCG